MKMNKQDWIEKVKTVDVITIGGYTYKQVMSNKNVSKNPKYWHLIKNTRFNDNPKYLFKSTTAESWEFLDRDIENPIRNTNQIYIRFLKVTAFVEPSNSFRRNKRYTSAPEDTLLYEKYWDDLENKIENGFEIDGVRITGRHFFTINFARFQAIPVDEYGKATNKRKIWTFLRFLDIQYYLFHELEDCLLDGNFSTLSKFSKWFPLSTDEDYELLILQSFVASKARRKGWSAIIGVGVLNYNFTFLPSSNNFIVAGEKTHYVPIRKAVSSTKTFLDKHTPWVRRTEVMAQREHMVASIKVKNEYGVETEEGYMSELKYESFKDNPMKGIGETAHVINIEEPGKFSNLLETYPLSIQPLIRDGETIIGTCIAGGTAGALESGASLGIYTMMYAPEAFGFKAYDNIYEEVPQNGKSGWFIDDLWYSPLKILKSTILGYDNSDKTKELIKHWKTKYINTTDEQGNSYRYFSKLILEEKRIKQRKTSIITYQKFITQQPMYLSEAFLVDESSPFDIGTAKEALGILKSEKDKSAAEPGKFVIKQGGNIKWNRDFKLFPVDEYPFKRDDTEGCWVIYQHPVKQKIINIEKKESIEEIASWRYLAATDPIDHGSDESSDHGKSKHSMAATYIIDALTRNIVAEYIGRPRTSEDYFEQLWRGIEYYNAILLYENNLKGLFSYFKMKNKLYLLANEPASLKDRVGYKQNNRIKGFHATSQINSYGRELIHRWSLEEVTVNQKLEGEVIFMPRMFSIPSVGLLQEMIMWNSKGNYDRISSFGALMILLFDREYNVDDEQTKEINVFGDSGIFKRVRQKMSKENPFKINFPI